MSDVRTINFGYGNFAKARSINYLNKVKKNPRIAMCWQCLDLQEGGYVVNYAYKKYAEIELCSSEVSRQTAQTGNRISSSQRATLLKN